MWQEKDFCPSPEREAFFDFLPRLIRYAMTADTDAMPGAFWKRAGQEGVPDVVCSVGSRST
jgi:hypothetical protein